jgi:hypothetical protein
MGRNIGRETPGSTRESGLGVPPYGRPTLQEPRQPMRLSSPTLLLALTLTLPAAAWAQASPASAPAARPKPAQLPADSMELGRKYTTWLYTTQVDSIIAHMDSASRAQPGVAKSIEDGSAQLAMSAGSEVKVLEEKFITRNGNRQYWRKATFSNIAEPFLLRLVINSKGQLMGMGMGFATQAPPIDP